MALLNLSQIARRRSSARRLNYTVLLCLRLARVNRLVNYFSLASTSRGGRGLVLLVNTRLAFPRVRQPEQDLGG